MKENKMILKINRVKTIFLLMTISVILFLAFSLCTGNESKPWSFGVMGDTQWTPSVFSDGKFTWGYDPEGTNPDSVSTSIITQINHEFIDKGVKFVIQVGDITDWGTDKAIASRADAAKELYDAGIGFFCMRGNHETYNNFYFPESAPNGSGIPAVRTHFPQHQGAGKNVFGAYNFSSPGSDKPGLENMATELKGMSYAFDYGEDGNNATFVIIDPWATQTRVISNDELHASYGYSIGTQQHWISSRLNLKSRGTRHAFVFSHQPLIACNHADSPFGFLDSAIDDQNTFYAELLKNKVAYYIAGHDHIHSRSMVTSPDGKNRIEQLICAPACPKFYKSRPADFWAWHGQKYRSTAISQELNNIGYYIFTIDGPQVTVDYYSDESGGFIGGKDWPDGKGSLITPKFNFVKKESWSYILIGKAYLIKQGDPYTIVSDSYEGTTASIISGHNTSTATDDLGAPLVKRVNTGWMTKKKKDNLFSNIFFLSGMADIGTKTTDTYTLSLTCDKKIKGDISKYLLIAKRHDNRWVNAVDLNNGGKKVFVRGPFNPSYSLGTYGIDKAGNTVWAVLNCNGSFSVGKPVDQK